MKRIIIAIAAMLALLTACGSPTPTATLVPPPTSTVAPLTSGPTLTAALAGLQATAEAIGSATAPEFSQVATASAVATGGSVALLPTFTTGAPGVATTSATSAAGGAITGSAVNAALGPNQINPCSLVTKSDVQAALGVSVQDPTLTTAPSGAIVCQFVATTSNAISAGITVYQGAAMNDAASQLTQGQAVTGLGDAAAFAGQALYVRTGNTVISVAVALSGQSANTAEQALAQQAILSLTVF